MLESPVLRELKAEWTREAQRSAIVEVLVARFGTEAEGLRAELDTIDDTGRLQELVKLAGVCSDLGSFRKRLAR
jgi:hypothetical protein